MLVLAHLGGACLIALLIAGPFLIADGYDSYDDLVMSFILLLWMGASLVFAIPGAMFAIYLVVQAVIIAFDD